jgi:hypothetical protein
MIGCSLIKTTSEQDTMASRELLRKQDNCRIDRIMIAACSSSVHTHVEAEHVRQHLQNKRAIELHDAERADRNGTGRAALAKS